MRVRDEVAGAAVCRNAPGRPGVGWVRQLGVRPPWRRRGLGTALLRASFGAFWERGTRSVGLGVDGENTTGAVALYERAGMRVEHRIDQLEKQIPLPSPTPAPAGRSPEPRPPDDAGGTMLSGPVLCRTVPSGLAPPASPEETER